MRNKRYILLFILFLSAIFFACSNSAVIKNIRIYEAKLEDYDPLINIDRNNFGYIDMFKSINELEGVRINSINNESVSNNLICVEANYIGDMSKFYSLIKEIANYENVAYIKDIDIYDDGENNDFKIKLYFVNNR